MDTHKRDIKYISTEQLRAILGCSDSTLRRWRKEHNDFPEPVRISQSPNAPMLWVQSEAYEWIDSRRGAV